MKRFFYSIFICLAACFCIPSVSEAAPKRERAPVVIIGGGVGALTSAVYLQRAGVETIVLEGREPGGAIAQSPSVHNWPGEIEISGRDLADKIKNQAIANGAKFLSHEATSVEFSNRPFKVHTVDVMDPSKTSAIEASATIVAVGSHPRLLGVPGESGNDGYWTKGVYSCAVCDGGLYKGRTVAVIGGGDSAIIEADYLSNLAKKVYLILRSDQFRTVETKRKDQLILKKNVEVIYNTQVSEIKGDGDKVTHLNLSTKKKLPIDGVFVAIGALPNTALFKGQLALNKQGYINLGHGQQTSVPGVFAIGDVIDPVYKQAITAAGDGAKAAMDVEHYLASSEPIYKSSTETATVTNETSTSTEIELPNLTNQKQFYQAVASGQTSPLVVDFYSPYCGPCQQLMPKLKKLAGQYEGKVRFLKVDVSEFQKLAGTYNIYAVPTVLIFDKDGKVVKRGQGLEEIGEVLNAIAQLSGS